MQCLGDCTENKQIPDALCKFTHYWHSDSTNLLDIEALNLVHGVEEGQKKVLIRYAMCLIGFLVVVVILVNLFMNLFLRNVRKEKQN